MTEQTAKQTAEQTAEQNNTQQMVALAEEALPYEEYVKLFRYENVTHHFMDPDGGGPRTIGMRIKIDNRTAAQKKAFRAMHKMSHAGPMRRVLENASE